MRLKMKENSLFAVLLRSPWWISFLVSAIIGVVAMLAMPLEYRALAIFSGGPFFIIGCMAAWRQWRTPSATKVVWLRNGKPIHAVNVAIDCARFLTKWSDFKSMYTAGLDTPEGSIAATFDISAVYCITPICPDQQHIFCIIW